MTPQDPQTRRDTSDQDLVRTRQRGRARVMGLLLGGFVILIFFITIAKIREGMTP